MLLMASLSSFVLLNSISLHIYHIFFIPLSIGGPLNYSHILAIVNNVSMNMQISFQIKISVSFKYPEVEMLEHMVVLFLIF